MATVPNIFAAQTGPIPLGQLDANFTAITPATVGAAASGANSDITSLSGLTTPLSVPQGGVGNQSVTCTQSGGALTFGLAATSLSFRSTTLTDGTSTVIRVASPLSIVLPSGGTLGFPTTIAGRMIVVAINNAGTSELAVISLAGGNDLSETGVINTTAISATATANNVFYSTIARTGVAYRVVGSVDATNTAGAWGNPTLVQGMGGNALTAMSSLGYGQTWQTVTRTSGVTYYNPTGKPIPLSAWTQSSSGIAGLTKIAINGGAPIVFVDGSVSTSEAGCGFFVVQPYCSYVITDFGTPTRVTSELR